MNKATSKRQREIETPYEELHDEQWVRLDDVELAEAEKEFTKNNEGARMRSAAKKGDSGAQFALAIMHITGSGGVNRDEDLAVKWISRAAKQGHSDGQHIYASMLEKGFGSLEVDIEAALGWFEKAAAQDNPDSLYRLAKLLRDNPNVTPDAIHVDVKTASSQLEGEEAAPVLSRNAHILSLLERATELGGGVDPQVFHDLAEALLVTHSNSNSTMPSAAVNTRVHDLLRKASAMGHYASMYRLSELYRAEGNLEEARSAMLEAAEEDYKPAQLALAAMLRSGEGGPVDEAEADEWERLSSLEEFESEIVE